MKTILTDDAARLLHMAPATLQRKARNGEIRGRKTGKHWVFLEEELVAYLRGEHTTPRLDASIAKEGKKEAKCQSINGAKRGGYSSPAQTENAYSEALGRKTSAKPKNTTTV